MLLDLRLQHNGPCVSTFHNLGEVSKLQSFLIVSWVRTRKFMNACPVPWRKIAVIYWRIMREKYENVCPIELQTWVIKALWWEYRDKNVRQILNAVEKIWRKSGSIMLVWEHKHTHTGSRFKPKWSYQLSVWVKDGYKVLFLCHWLWICICLDTSLVP